MASLSISEMPYFLCCFDTVCVVELELLYSLLSHLVFQYLSGSVHREALNEINVSRTLVLCHSCKAEVLDLLRRSGLRFSKSHFWEDTVFTLDLVTYVKRAVLLPDITYSYLCRKNSLSDIHESNKIKKEDILQYLETVEQLKQGKERLRNKDYYPNRCYVAVMSDFYIICNILKRGKNVTPQFTAKELRHWLWHPASLSEILSFKQRRMQNVILYLISKLPSALCILLIKTTAKRKGLI